MKESTIQKLIGKAIDAGTGRDDIIVDLFSNHALSLGQANKQVAKYMKDNGLIVKKVSFDDTHNEWLLDADPENPRTVIESELFVTEHGSDNVKKHMCHFSRNCELIAKAFAKGVAAKK